MKRICIVFEETEPQQGGMGFNVYLENGEAIKERYKAVPPDEWPTVVFWATQCFRICAEAIRQSGAIQKTIQEGLGK